MREARRFDLRNGHNTHQKINQVEEAVLSLEQAVREGRSDVDVDPEVRALAAEDLRRNKDIELILQELMNPGECIMA